MDNFHIRSNFGSMGVDEYLSNIWYADENQGTSQPRNQEASDTNCMQDPNVVSDRIPRKSADEVWSEIQSASKNVSCGEVLQQQQTAEPMSLEAFLARAGVVEESPSPPAMPSPQMTSCQNQKNNPADPGFGVGLGQAIRNMASCTPCDAIGRGTHTRMSFPCSILVMESVDANAAETSPAFTDTSEADNTKSAAENSMEMVVEKKQRRMLKNRESAARSRARRQAYTVELEAELCQLKQENEKLRHSLAKAEEKRKKVILERKLSVKRRKGADRLRKLRKTCSE